jgi:hypothetical protein
MDSHRLYIHFSPEVERDIADNALDIPAVLKTRGLQLQLQRAADPAVRGDNALKDTALVLVATASVIAAATPLLKEVIQAISRRTVLVKDRKTVPVEDSSGNIVTNSNGQPLLQWVETAHVVQTGPPASERQVLGIKGPMGISISYESVPRISSPP